MADPNRMMGANNLYATRFHHVPTVAGVGSLRHTIYTIFKAGLLRQMR